jgi:hypothetical protein
MFTAAQTLALAHAYSAATGLSLYQVGIKACNNNKIFPRLAAGLGCQSGSLERAGAFFVANWPAYANWPEDVPGGPRRRRRRLKAAAERTSAA